MHNDKFSALDLLDLSDLQRTIFRYLMANDDVTINALQTSLQADAAEIDAAIASLLVKQRVRQAEHGILEAISGRVIRRTALPPQFWSPYSVSPRSFSPKDIQILRTAIPILRFARAKLAEFSDHGPTHALRVRGYATQLGHVVKLTSTEQFYLRIAALFHDVGNVVDRKIHHIVSQQTVERLAALGELPLTPEEATVAGLVCRWHRKEYDPNRQDLINGEIIRTGLLGSLIRVADAMDIDSRRSDYAPDMLAVLSFFFHDDLPYWTSLDEIYGVRICCTPDIRLQVFTRPQVADNMQINMLRQDLASTPLEWTVEQIPLIERTPTPSSGMGKALLTFPFEAHSLVMAAISRKHLRADGYEVECLCYADTTESAQFLWRDDLGELLAREITQVVVIGGRLREDDVSLVTSAVIRMTGRGTAVSIINRHEQTWTWSPWLLQSDVEVIFGADRMYFWGLRADSVDMLWGRVAALCGRDPSQAALHFSIDENRLANGLLMTLHNCLNRYRYDDSVDWTKQAEVLLNAIEDDNKLFFYQHSDEYSGIVAPMLEPHIYGRLIVFETMGDILPQDLYWMLEAEIERRGLAMEHDIHFLCPYAIAMQQDGNGVNLLAIRHWREEAAPPIRLLFPDDSSLVLQGNENTVYVRLSIERAAELLAEMTATCNR
jgi:hypothetical protein